MTIFVTDILAVLLTAARRIDGLVRSTPPDVLARRADGHADQFHIDVEADRVATDVLVGAGFGVLSEESGRQNPDAPITVVVDPIDGSTNCSRGISHYGPSLCALDESGPLAAVVHNIHTGSTYSATRGGGARKNGRQLAPIRRSGVDLIITGDPCPALEYPSWTRLSGASAHDLCLVAEGAVDAYVDWRNTQSIWDYAGAMLVLAESGGAVCERNGATLLDLDARMDRKLMAASSPEQLGALAVLVDERLAGDLDG